MKETIVLLQKTYHGFECFFDYFRDVAEVCDFPHDKEFNKIKGEFQGRIEVSVKFYPEPDDYKEVNK